MGRSKLEDADPALIAPGWGDGRGSVLRVDRSIACGTPQSTAHVFIAALGVVGFAQCGDPVRRFASSGDATRL